MAERSKREIYLGVSKHYSSTVNLVHNPEAGVISPQYHCFFDDTFSTNWSDGQFDPLIWDYLVQQVDRHFTVKLDSNGHITLPNDFSQFSPDIPAHVVLFLNLLQLDHFLYKHIPTILGKLQLPSQHNTTNTYTNIDQINAYSANSWTTLNPCTATSYSCIGASSSTACCPTYHLPAG